MSTLLTGIGNFFDPSNADGSLNQPKFISNMGLFTGIMGSLNSAVGSYYAAKSAQYQARSQALNSQYQSDIAVINSRQAEYTAESDIKSGQSQIANMTMRAGQEKSAATANMAARGIALGKGTTQDVSASMDIIKDIDKYTINSNAVREASAARTQATGYQNQALMDRTSAANLNRSADSISPFSAMSQTLLTSASSIASSWNSMQRWKMWAGSNPLVSLS